MLQRLATLPHRTNGLGLGLRGTPGRTEEPWAWEIPWPHVPQTALIGLLKLGSSSTRGRLYALRVGLPLGTLHLGGVEGLDGGIRIGVYALGLSRFNGAAHASESKKLNRVSGAWSLYPLPVHRFFSPESITYFRDKFPS